MPSSKLKTLWKGGKPLVNLKTINLSDSGNLKITPDFRDTKLVEKLLLRGCKSLLKVHPSIGNLTNLRHLDLRECGNLKELPEPISQLTKLGHLDLGGCVNLQRLPEPIKQLTNMCNLILSHCHNLKRLPEQLGDMECLKILDVSYTPIEQLPDSIANLKELVNLNLRKCEKFRKLPEQFGNMKSLKSFDASCSAIEELPDTFAGLNTLVNLRLGWCKNLRILPNSICKLKFLEVLDLCCSSKLEQLPKQLEKMQCLKELTASFTSIQEVPDSIELLSRLQVLDLDYCWKLKYVPSSIWNLTSLAKLHIQQDDTSRMSLPDTVKDMKLKSLRLGFNASSWLPVIQSFPSLESLHLNDEGQSFSSNGSYSLSKLSNLRDLILCNYTNQGCSFPELPLNLTSLFIDSYATLVMLPDLSSLKQLKQLSIIGCISLQSLPPLPPHLENLRVCKCTSLQDVPDLSMLMELRELSFVECSNLTSVSLEQSSLQVTSKYLSFEANLPNREIAEWFSYKSCRNAISFDIPPILGDNFSGVALWIVYKYRSGWRCMDRGMDSVMDRLYMRAVITNSTKGIKNNYDIALPDATVGGEESRVEFIRKSRIFTSGDRIKVSFQSLLYCHSYTSGELEAVPDEEVKVKMCGAHVIQKTLSPPRSVLKLARRARAVRVPSRD